MSAADLVRASRDGDQFHYVWAARQCLGLLAEQGGLTAVTIEGASVDETYAGALDAGEELIDVGLYYASQSTMSASAVRYVQLKHSTAQTNVPWTASGLERTIKGFAGRYVELAKASTAADVAQRFSFRFTTNRPIDHKVVEALDDLRSGAPARRTSLEAQLLGYTGLADAEARAFFALFHAEGLENDLWNQHNLLVQDLRAYLPDADSDAPVQLKELVTRKATSQFKDNPAIVRYDVLRALKVGEEELFPAPAMIEGAKDAFAREQEPQIVEALLSASGPVVLHADGGVGKSMVAVRLAQAMPEGSASIVYDCFGTGLYRSSLDFRHRHRDGLVQIANELAAKSLCDPLIPSSHADAKAYMRAFLHRLRQASTVLRASAPNAVLCLVIDAADNAEMAAAAQQEPGSFARDLIRAPIPEGVRLVFTCRSHRRASLEAPPHAVEIPLRPFSLAETTTHLRRSYPLASDSEIAEFAHLTSANPRVQALAMDRKLPLSDMLATLGPNPTTIEAAIGELLAKAIKALKDKARGVGEQQIEQICQGLAVLRPLVPISVLSRLTGVDESAIRTFAFDLGRPLLVRGGTLHFLDEPAETWFRETFTPDTAGLNAFIDRLRPMAGSSAYVAGAIPQLLLEAGRYDELVALALSSEALPTDSPLERRDVELQRLTFALKACLRIKSHLPAAKLALKAAGETAAEHRQNTLLQSNIHLAGLILAPDRLQELVSRRTFKAGWRGSHHAYDAALLSARPEFSADAASRLRMAMEWLLAWARQAQDEEETHDSKRGQVTDDDRAVIALAHLRVHGARDAARFLRRWRHRPISFTAGRILARKLIDVGDFEALDALALSCRNNVWLLLALAEADRSCARAMPIAALERLLRLVGDRRVQLEEAQNWNCRWDYLGAVTAAVELAVRQLPAASERWSALLRRYLPTTPPRDFSSDLPYDRAATLRSYALEAALRGQSLSLEDVTPDDVRGELGRDPRPHSLSRNSETFLRETGGVLAWVQLSVDISCGRRPDDLGAAIAQAAAASDKAAKRGYRETQHLRNNVAVLWIRILNQSGFTSKEAVNSFTTWIAQGSSPLWAQTLTSLCRVAARTEGLESLALDLCNQTLKHLEGSRDDAHERTDAYLSLARAIYTVSPEEASAVLDRAVAIADRIGEENLDRWAALLHLANAAGRADISRPRTAYRLSRAAELTYEYVVRDKHFDWRGTAKALTELCPSSSLTIFSRWRDRRFGDPGRLLPIAIERFAKKDLLPGMVVPVLSSLSGHWDRLEGLERFMAQETTPWRREVGAKIVYRYKRLLPTDPEAWDKLAQLVDQNGLDLPDLDRLRLVRPTEPAAPLSPPKPTSQLPDAADATTPQGPDWDEIFRDIDPGVSAALRQAYSRWRAHGPPFYMETFVAQAAQRLKSGRETSLLRALAEWPDFDIYNLRSFLEGAPPTWMDRLSFRQALKTAVLTVCRRNPIRVYRRGYLRLIPFDELFAKGVLTESEAVDAMLDGFTDQVDMLDAGELFRLLDPVAASLTPDQADEALHYGLDLLEPVLKVDDGDGPWSNALTPPADLVDALAGYIWASLASPIAATRWEFAHLVRNAMDLRWDALLEALAKRALAFVPGPFADVRLPFYGWHGRQWLLLGLARGALSTPEALAPFVPQLTEAVLGEHVVIAELARRCLLAWASTSQGATLDRALLDQVNHRRQPQLVYDNWSREVEGEEDECASPPTDEEKYYFGLDVGQYWLAPMGRVFGLSQDTTERRAFKALRENLAWDGGRREDARYARKIFGDSETSHSHGTLPDTDDLGAYHGYHAMMLAAGALLKTHRVGQKAQAQEDDFADWMDGKLLRRDDGRWLSDRADPAPFQRGQGAGVYDRDWIWSVGRDHLDRQLMTADGRQVLWGDWSAGDSSRRETVNVKSALVTAAAAGALLAALQTAPDPSRVGLPDAESSESTKLDQAKLFGWVDNHNIGSGLDEQDPWAKGLRYPGAVPAADITAKLGLEPDADGRWWHHPQGGSLLSETWTVVEGYGREESANPCWRLSGDRAFVSSLLEAHPEHCLVLSVKVRRPLPDYDRRAGQFIDYPWPYARFYLMRSDGVAVPF